MNYAPKRIQDLRIFPCLSRLSDKDLAIIGKKAELRTVDKNAVLFFESDPVKFFFILKEGSIKLSKFSKNGKELIIRIMKPEDYFCCTPLLTGGKSLVNANATDDSTLITIPGDYFKKILFNGTNEIGIKIIRTLCSKIEYLSHIVEDLAFKDVEHRIIISLLKLAEERFPNNNESTLKITHQILASMSGTVREVVSRTLLKLKKKRVITDTTVRGISVNKEKLVRYLFDKTASIKPE